MGRNGTSPTQSRSTVLKGVGASQSPTQSGGDRAPTTALASETPAAPVPDRETRGVTAALPAPPTGAPGAPIEAEASGQLPPPSEIGSPLRLGSEVEEIALTQTTDSTKEPPKFMPSKVSTRKRRPRTEKARAPKRTYPAWLPPPEKVSVTTAAFLQKAVTDKTSARYDATVRTYIAWCEERELNPLHPDACQIADFLADEAQTESLGQQATRSRRTAISHYLSMNGVNNDVCTSSLITQLLTGIGKSKPAKAKSTTTWDFARILKLFSSDWAANEKLDTNQLLAKMVVLMMAAGSRAMDTTNIIFSESRLRFGIAGCEHSVALIGVTKTSKLAKVESTVQGEANNPLCTHCAVAEWVKKRPEDSEDFLLVFPEGNPRAGKRISSDWTRNCVRAAMTVAGVPPEFGAHSVRAAASSKAAMLGHASFSQIISRFRWAPGSGTFQRHYSMEIEGTRHPFDQALLSGALSQMGGPTPTPLPPPAPTELGPGVAAAQERPDTEDDEEANS